MKITESKINSPHFLQRSVVLLFLCIMTLFCTSSFAQTNKGKDFWLAETPNLGNRGDFAISVANPGLVPVTIKITNPVRASVNATIAAGSLQTFTFSTESGNIQGTNTYTNNVYHVTSDKDVVVYDFTPLVNAFTNDAALILPTNSLGKKYRPGSYVNPIGNSQGSFFGVVATENNTNVKTFNRLGTLVDNITINQGQYFQRNNGSTPAQDITGWYIETDKPAAVFSGNVCTSIGNSTGACDHIDEQVLPLESMASAYVACPTSTRPIGCNSPANCAPDVFRYVATEDGTVISTSPNVGGGAINKGQFIEISTSTPHIVTSNNKPFYGYQYIVSQNSGSPVAGIGDPSLLGMPPVDQFQFDYIFLIPNSFPSNFINVVAPMGTNFTLDGSPVTATCKVVGTLNSVTYCTFNLPVSFGVHRIFADKQFGLIISGFGQFASYAYLGGVGLQPINAGCNTGGPYQLTTCNISSIQLNGNGTCSDGSTPTSIQWTSSDGVTFSNPNIANPTATVPGYGTFNICLTVTCGGNTVQCCSQITVIEPAGGCNAPPVAVCKPVAVSANANCQGTAVAAAFNGGSTDADGDALTFSVLPAGPYAIGVTNVTLTVTDTKGASSSCNTTITVVDDEKPKAICKPVSVTLKNGTASITAADDNDNSTDNCGIASYTLSNSSFSCSDIGSNNTVTLTVTDIHGNFSTCTATVTVVGEIPSCTIASIPTSNIYTGGVSTNLYLGYGAQSTTLKVTPAANGAPYTYLWSGPAGLSSTTSDAPVFTATTAGQFTFVVTTTNVYGCSNTCSITICVTDIRVPGTDGKKVYVCHTPPGNAGNPNTLSISVNAVSSHLGNHAGDKLGSCGQTLCTSMAVGSNATNNTSAQSATKEGVTATEEEFSVRVSPNPSANYFTLKLESRYTTPVSLKVMDANGRVVDAKSAIGSNSTIQVGQNYSSGTYYAEMIQGTRRKVVQLIKASK